MLRIFLIETETPQNRNPKYPNSLNKIRSKSVKTKKITESNQIKKNKKTLKRKLHQNEMNIKHTRKTKKYDIK